MKHLRNRAGLAAAALISSAPLAGQTTDAGMAPSPPRDQQSKPAITPQQVIGVVKGLIKPKPAPTVFPTPSPAPAATPSLTPSPSPSPAPRSTPDPISRPAQTGKPVPAIGPSPRPVPVQAPAPSVSEPVPTIAPTEAVPFPEPASPMPKLPTAVPLDPLPTAPGQPWWLWLAAGLGAAGVAELARRWFWPKPALSFEIAAGPTALSGSSSPAFSAPEIAISIRIEPGVASAPTGDPVVILGDPG